MTPAQRQTVLDGLTAQFPNPNPAGVVAVRSSDVTAYVMTTL